jgi:hypothetical protein
MKIAEEDGMINSRNDRVQRSLAKQGDRISADGEEDESDVDVQDERSCFRDD